MLTLEGAILTRHIFSARWRGDPRANRWHELELRSGKLLAKKLVSDRAREDFPEQGWNRVTNLPVYCGVPACNDHVVRKGLQPAQLSHREASIRPVEGAYRGARLCLKRPRRLALGELQQESPKPAPPSKQRKASAAIRMPEVVAPFWYRGQKISPLPSNAKIFVRLGTDVSESIPRRAICRAGRNELPLELLGWPVSLPRKLECGTVARGNQKETLPKLRHPMVRRFQHLEPRRVVNAVLLVDLSDTSK